MEFYAQPFPPSPWFAAGNGQDDEFAHCHAAQCLYRPSVAFTVISSAGSIVGSLLIICTFLTWKDLRTVARMILVFLAISDLFTGLGYMFGAAIYIQYYYTYDHCSSSGNATSGNDSNSTNALPNSTTYQRLCTAQSFFTTLMPMASFLWTANLAIYLFFSIMWQRIKFTRVLMIVFHVTAWGIPLVTCVAIVSTGYFGPSESRTSGGWCWITFDSHHDSKIKYYVIEFMAGKMWEIGVCVLALVICIAVKIVVWRRFKKTKTRSSSQTTPNSSIHSGSIDKQLQAAYAKLDQKLLWLPMAFLLLRLWGNLRFIISITCPHEHCCKILYHWFLVYMQSICDPGQGWSNAILFVFFNQKILHRLCPCLEPCWEACCSTVRRKLRKMKRKKGVKPRVARRVNHVNVSVEGASRDVFEGREGSSGDERTPLLLSVSQSSNHSNSVLYHSGPQVASNDLHSNDLHSNKPKPPSINSKY